MQGSHLSTKSNKDGAALFRAKKAPLEKSLSIQEPLVVMMTAVMWDLGSHLGVSLYLIFDVSLNIFQKINCDYHIYLATYIGLGKTFSEKWVQ